MHYNYYEGAISNQTTKTDVKPLPPLVYQIQPISVHGLSCIKIFSHQRFLLQVVYCGKTGTRYSRHQPVPTKTTRSGSTCPDII